MSPPGGATHRQSCRSARASSDCRSSLRRRSSAPTAPGTSPPSNVVPAAGGTVRRLDCDLVCVSGGLSPAIQLFAQGRGAVRYDETLAALVPNDPPHVDPAGRRGERALRSFSALGGRARRGRRRRATGNVAHAPPKRRLKRRRSRPERRRRCGAFSPAGAEEAIRRPAERRHGRGHRACGARRLSPRSSI